MVVAEGSDCGASPLKSGCKSRKSFVNVQDLRFVTRSMNSGVNLHMVPDVVLVV